MVSQSFAGWRLRVEVSGSSVFSGGTSGWIVLDGIQRLTYKIVEGIEAKEECGTRYPTLVEGQYGTSGTLERFYTGSGSWTPYVVGNNPVQFCALQIYPNGSGSAQPFIILSGIKFEESEVSHRPMANLMTETWTFIGTGSLSNSTTG
jgi:hypothetical protein